MISAKPTENLTGITIEGTHDDFYEIVESIYRITGLEDSYSDPYWSVKNRLLGVCYDIRHAYMGDREVNLVNNGVSKELMKYHSMIMPEQEVHFSTNILFPEAIFVAMSTPYLYPYASSYYINSGKGKNDDDIVRKNYAKYRLHDRDKAILDLLCGVILEALGQVIGDEELYKITKNSGFYWGGEAPFYEYATMYIDKCNLDYLKTDVEKRPNKLKNIAKRIAKQPDAYRNMKRDLKYSAQRYGCSIHELEDPKLEYPEDIEW